MDLHCVVVYIVNSDNNKLKYSEIPLYNDTDRKLEEIISDRQCLTLQENTAFTTVIINHVLIMERSVVMKSKMTGL
jgi:hypothetical protein